MNQAQFYCRSIKRMCSCAGRLLPGQYQQVEWIQGGNGQYIDTGVVPFQSLGIEGGGVFGLYGGTPDYYTLIGGRFSYDNGYVLQGLETQFRFTYGNNMIYIPVTDIVWFKFTPRTDMNFYWKKSNGTMGSTPIYGDFSPKDISLYIGALNNNGSAAGSSAIINYLRFYTAGALSHDYIPCYRKSDNKTGMYDLVTSTFYPNLGSGEFAIGNNV